MMEPKARFFSDKSVRGGGTESIQANACPHLEKTYDCLNTITFGNTVRDLPTR